MIDYVEIAANDRLIPKVHIDLAEIFDLRQDNDFNDFKQEGNKYYFKIQSKDSDKNSYYLGSNFVLINPYLIAGADPKRFLIIINEFGEEKEFVISASDFASLQKFKGLTEGLGNFMFYGSNQNLQRVKSILFSLAKSATEIDYLGWHSDKGVYAFSNGIIKPAGHFQEVNENGFCGQGDEHYFLPFYSNVYTDNNTFENFRKFRHINDVKVNFKVWSEMFFNVYGENAAIAIAYLIASIFRDIVFNYLHCFPHLFLFGPPQSGKSMLSESIQYTFGLPQTPINLEAGSTAVGTFRKLEQVSNSIIAVNEYKNTIEPKLIGLLKATYDGQSREYGVKSNDNRTQTGKVRSSMIIAGQDLPTNDAALFSRIMPLNFHKRDSYSIEEKNNFDSLQHFQRNGLTNVLFDILAHREHFQKSFAYSHKLWVNHLKTQFRNSEGTERSFSNYAILLAAIATLKDKLDLPFSLDEFKTILNKQFSDYIELLKSSTDVSNFWNTFYHLFQKYVLIPDKHFAIKIDKNNKEYIALHWNIVYPEYKEHMIKQRNVPLNEKTLQSYLKNTPEFIKATNIRIGDFTPWAFCFDYEKLNLSIKKEYNPENDLTT